MNKILVVTLLCVAAASAATKTKTSAGASKRGFGIGTHDAHPEVVTVGGHGHGGGGGDGWGATQHHGDYPALADIVALVLNLLVLAAFGGLVYMLLSPLLSDGHGDGWGRSATSSPYFDAIKDGGIMSRVLNSIDYVDTTFAVMKIQSDGCRKRIACEMERTAGRNKMFNYATGWFRKQMRSMDFYKDAVSAADDQKDCAIQYPDCTYTLVDKVGKWVSN